MSFRARSHTRLRATIASVSVAAVAATGGAAATPASAAATWTAPVEAAPAVGSANGGQFIDLSRDGTQISYITQDVGQTWFAANVVERTGDTSFDTPIALSSPTNTYGADQLASARDGGAVVYAYSENYQQASSGPRGNRVVSGTWQGVNDATSFSTGSWLGYVSISDDGSRIAWKNSNDNTYTATWSADGTAGTPVLIGTGTGSPFLSGDGKSIAFTQEVNSLEQVFVATLNGSTWTSSQVTTGAEVHEVIGISSSGEQIIYEDYADDYLFGSRKVNGAWVTNQLIAREQESFAMAADGSAAWKDYDNGNLYTTQFRGGNWETPQNLGGDVEHVSISDDGQTILYADDSRSLEPMVRTFSSAGWVDPYELESGVQAVGTAVAGDGCSVAYALNTSAIRYARTAQPCAPGAVSAVAASATSAAVTWTPSNPGTSLTTSYTVSTYKDGVVVADKTCTLMSPFPEPLTCTVTGLTTGQTYTFVVTASSAEGAGPVSAQSNSVLLADSTVVKPAKVQAFKVAGGPRARKYVLTWHAPVNSGNQPLAGYRLKLRQIGQKRFIVNKSLASSVNRIRFTRSYLLKNSTRKRGDAKGVMLRYIARIEAVNPAGSGPLSAARFRVMTGVKR